MFRTANSASAFHSPRSGPSVGSSASAASPAGLDRHATGSSRSSGPKRYPHRLNFYNKPPTMEVTIDQFESWAIDRLKVLAEIESRQSRNNSYKELKEGVLKKMDQYLPLGASTSARNGIDVEAERMKDHISHFVLRLAFCKTEDLQRRFIRTETVLFRLRFETDDSMEREAFLRTLDLNWETVTPQEKATFKDELLAATPSLSVRDWDSEAFFKVPWTKVPDLVEKRKVFLRRGVAWVPMREQSSLVLAEFSSRLSKELEFTARSLPRLDEDDRLLPLLNHLSLGFLAGLSSDFANSSTAMVDEDGQAIETRADMVNALVQKHAPMCMRQMGRTLEERKHLKHQGRLQFGLFLKEMGLGVDQAMLFWRRSFANITDDKFNKEYRYNVRYNYGLEGKRVDYPARSCARIIMQDTPGPQDTHGCPFRHYSTQNLSAALSSGYGLSSQQNSEILATVKAGHYHVACTRLFEMTHGVSKGKGLDGKGESVAHPNRYFERSWKLEHEGGGAGIKSEDDAENDAEQSRTMGDTSLSSPSASYSRAIKREPGLDDSSMIMDADSAPRWTKAALGADASTQRSILVGQEEDAKRSEKASTPDSGIVVSSSGRHDGDGGNDDDEFGFGDDAVADADFDFDALDRAAAEKYEQHAKQSQSQSQEHDVDEQQSGTAAPESQTQTDVDDAAQEANSAQTQSMDVDA